MDVKSEIYASIMCFEARKRLLVMKREFDEINRVSNKIYYNIKN